MIVSILWRKKKFWRWLQRFHRPQYPFHYSLGWVPRTENRESKSIEYRDSSSEFLPFAFLPTIYLHLFVLRKVLKILMHVPIYLYAWYILRIPFQTSVGTWIQHVQCTTMFFHHLAYKYKMYVIFLVFFTGCYKILVPLILFIMYNMFHVLFVKLYSLLSTQITRTWHATCYHVGMQWCEKIDKTL